MMKCSFCNKDETQVAKLVAGPTVFICDKCVEIAYRIMREDNAVGQSFWSRIRHRLRQHRNTPPRRTGVMMNEITCRSKVSSRAL